MLSTFVAFSCQNLWCNLNFGTVAMSGACASDAVERVVAAKAAAKTLAKAVPKTRGRHRNVDRPRIDIDDEIESANELSVLMKKISHAAKISQRNSVRSKARLVKKCAKMSVQDLERLAVLKRCGLLVGEEPQDAPSKATSSSSAPAAATPPRKRKSSMEMLKKLADVVSKSGGGDVLSCVTDLQELMKNEEKERHIDGGRPAGKQLVLPMVGAANDVPEMGGEHEKDLDGDTAMEAAADEKEDPDVEEEL